MHNELFNENSVHTYYAQTLSDWSYISRDVLPAQFLEQAYTAHAMVPSRCHTTMAIGFKSFPEHYFDDGMPHCTLHEVFDTLMADYDVKKVILYRENVFAVFLSMSRSYLSGHYLTKNYDAIKITINIKDLQSFIDRYEFHYNKYKEMSRGQKPFVIIYEELCSPSYDDIMLELFRYLGVAPVLPSALSETVPQSSLALSDVILNYDEVEFAFRHTRYSKFLPPLAIKKSHTRATRQPGTPSRPPRLVKSSYRWSLLTPICSFGISLQECEDQLVELRYSLDATIVKSDRALVELVFGVDKGDVAYDTPKGRNMLHRVFSGYSIIIEILDDVHGKICKIWNALARVAAARGTDFLLLIGDDIRFESKNWKQAIEQSFADISKEQNVPFGFACVAFHDNAFPGFPTFPVLHKSHLEIFESMIPFQFINQGGDPYLYELYSRFSCAKFASGAVLTNTLGGKLDTTRYEKRHIRWNNHILTNGIRTLESSVGRKANLCIDVVVPTYRCDISILKAITSLRVTSQVVNCKFYLVVDNPEAANIKEVLSLEHTSANYSVIVIRHKGNFGASASRNTGLDYSNADFVVLLDDDVTPSDHLLEAYVGAIVRYPDARVFVGTTHLPDPVGALTHAYYTSDLIGSFRIAEKRRDPPWGVTANLCVRGRSSKSRFQLDFPKTGGGEDIDFCIRSSKYFPNSMVSVPGALAYHPWWGGGAFGSLLHIKGWAAGESLLISSKVLEEYVYLTCPNGAEFCVLLPFFLALYCAFGGRPHPLKLAVIPAVIIIIELIWHRSHVVNRVHPSIKPSFMARSVIPWVAAAIIMFQETCRFTAHLHAHHFRNLFWRFDWVCGKNPAYIRSQVHYSVVKAVVYFLWIFWVLFHM